MKLCCVRGSSLFLSLVGLSVGAIVSGCNSNHPKGAIVALYEKDGGPVFKKSDGSYDTAAINKFFAANPTLTKGFVEHPGGVCNQTTASTLSDEADANRLICGAAIIPYHMKYDTNPVSQ